MEAPERVQQSFLGRAVLLVEDNEDEVLMMQRAFRKAHIPNPLKVAKNGEEALAYLEGLGVFADRAAYPMPNVVFLDLNMPKKSGLEVLQYVRQHLILKALTINILTASVRPADIEQAAQLGANAYFIKPARIEKFQELVESWFSLTRFEAYPTIV